MCATTLTGLHTSYPVTACTQAITYSTALSYARSVPAGVTDPSNLPLQTITYEYLAPWQSLAPGAPTPLADVTERVCWSTSAGEVCDDMRMVEVTSVHTSTTTVTTTVDVSTTITGPSDVWIGTWHAPVTEVETFMTTSGTQVLEYSYETTSTGMSPAAAGKEKVRFTRGGPPVPVPAEGTLTSTFESTAPVVTSTLGV